MKKLLKCGKESTIDNVRVEVSNVILFGKGSCFIVGKWIAADNKLISILRILGKYFINVNKLRHNIVTCKKKKILRI